MTLRRRLLLSAAAIYVFLFKRISRLLHEAAATPASAS